MSFEQIGTRIEIILESLDQEIWNDRSGFKHQTDSTDSIISRVSQRFESTRAKSGQIDQIGQVIHHIFIDNMKSR